MVDRISHFTGKQQQEALNNVIQRNPGQHGIVQQCREVMMKVQDPGHRPERRVMQDPSEKEPLAGVRYLAALLEEDGVVDAASLLAHGRVNVKYHEYREEDYVCPPNHGVAEQVYPLIVPGEELPLQIEDKDFFRIR